jgi:hypothetical protein
MIADARTNAVRWCGCKKIERRTHRRKFIKQMSYENGWCYVCHGRMDNSLPVLGNCPLSPSGFGYHNGPRSKIHPLAPGFRTLEKESQTMRSLLKWVRVVQLRRKKSEKIYLPIHSYTKRSRGTLYHTQIVPCSSSVLCEYNCCVKLLHRRSTPHPPLLLPFLHPRSDILISSLSYPHSHILTLISSLHISLPILAPTPNLHALHIHYWTLDMMICDVRISSFPKIVCSNLSIIIIIRIEPKFQDKYPKHANKAIVLSHSTRIRATFFFFVFVSKFSFLFMVNWH